MSLCVAEGFYRGFAESGEELFSGVKELSPASDLLTGARQRLDATMSRLVAVGSGLADESRVPPGLDWVHGELQTLGLTYDEVFLLLGGFRDQYPEFVPAQDVLLRAEDLLASQRRTSDLLSAPDSLAADVWREFESQRDHIRAIGRQIGAASRFVQGGEVTVGQYYRDSGSPRRT